MLNCKRITSCKSFLQAFFIVLLVSFSVVFSVFAAETYTLKTGISIDKVPQELYGTWRVSSNLISTNSPQVFKKNSVDLWNLSKSGNVITLDNPFSGAKASIVLEEVNNNLIRFTKTGDYDNKKLTDTVEIKLDKETFSGVNYLKLTTISEVDGHVIKSETATYRLDGEKISGQSIK